MYHPQHIKSYMSLLSNQIGKNVNVNRRNIHSLLPLTMLRRNGSLLSVSENASGTWLSTIFTDLGKLSNDRRSFSPSDLQKRSPYINISSRSELFHTGIIFTFDQDNACKELQAQWIPVALPNLWLPW